MTIDFKPNLSVHRLERLFNQPRTAGLIIGRIFVAATGDGRKLLIGSQRPEELARQIMRQPNGAR